MGERGEAAESMDSRDLSRDHPDPLSLGQATTLLELLINVSRELAVAVGHTKAMTTCTHDNVEKLTAKVDELMRYMGLPRQRRVDLQTRLHDAESALAELVRLKDGPRDAAYEQDKPIAWSRARAVLAQIPAEVVE